MNKKEMIDIKINTKINKEIFIHKGVRFLKNLKNRHKFKNMSYKKHYITHIYNLLTNYNLDHIKTNIRIDTHVYEMISYRNIKFKINKVI